MKVRLMIPQKVKNPKYSAQAHEQMSAAKRQYNQKRWVWQPAGYEIDADDPKNAADGTIWKLVVLGSCEAADDECRNRVVRYYRELGHNVTDWESVQVHLEKAKRDYKKRLKGIHPEDYDKFEMGEISGYAPDGSYILGPNGMPLEFDAPPEDV